MGDKVGEEAKIQEVSTLKHLNTCTRDVASEILHGKQVCVATMGFFEALVILSSCPFVLVFKKLLEKTAKTLMKK